MTRRSTPPPFPTPDELSEQQRRDAEPLAELLRIAVRAAFAKGPNSSGIYSPEMPEGISEDAKRIVTEELRDAGWAVERGSDQRNQPYFEIHRA